MTGETLFTARARLNLPESCNTAEVWQQLEQSADDLIAEILRAELRSRLQQAE
ncbi:MAG TPA: hypothetical protein PLC99_07355 [Verrucomicrobiota bacterium]|nr:hypothetical protein [Verrucomicrobiota bacterium]